MAQLSKLLLPALGCCALPLYVHCALSWDILPSSTESVLFLDLSSTESVFFLDSYVHRICLSWIPIPTESAFLGFSFLYISCDRLFLANPNDQTVRTLRHLLARTCPASWGGMRVIVYHPPV